MPRRAELIVDVRIVDDFAGQEDRAIGEAGACLIGVVHGAIDAVAEPELRRETDGEPAGLVAIAIRPDSLDEGAVIARGELAGDGRP